MGMGGAVCWVKGVMGCGVGGEGGVRGEGGVGGGVEDNAVRGGVRWEEAKNGVRNHFGRHFTNIVYIIKKMF